VSSRSSSPESCFAIASATTTRTIRGHPGLPRCAVPVFMRVPIQGQGTTLGIAEGGAQPRLEQRPVSPRTPSGAHPPATRAGGGGVVLVPPGRRQGLRLPHVGERLVVRQLMMQARVEAFGVAVLSRRSEPAGQVLNARQARQPPARVEVNADRAVVAAHARRSAESGTIARVSRADCPAIEDVRSSGVFVPQISLISVPRAGSEVI